MEHMLDESRAAPIVTQPPNHVMLRGVAGGKGLTKRAGTGLDGLPRTRYIVVQRAQQSQTLDGGSENSGRVVQG